MRACVVDLDLAGLLIGGVADPVAGADFVGPDTGNAAVFEGVAAGAVGLGRVRRSQS